MGLLEGGRALITGGGSGIGVGALAPLHEAAPAEVARLVDVNLLGAYHGLRAAIPHLRASGDGARGRRGPSRAAGGGAPRAARYAPGSLRAPMP